MTYKKETIDFEKELYKAFGQVKDFTLGMRIAKWFYDIGKNSQESVSEDLEIELTSYMENSFTSVEEPDEFLTTVMQKDDLLAFARHFANWQKEQDQETIELAEDHTMLAGMEKMKEQMIANAVETTFNVSLPSSLYDKLWIKGCKEGDKLLVIKKENYE